MVVDFGGGTLDVSVLRIRDAREFTVLATNGDMRLGGDDFDQRILRHFQSQFLQEHHIDLADDVEALTLLRQKAEKAKVTTVKRSANSRKIRAASFRRCSSVQCIHHIIRI